MDNTLSTSHYGPHNPRVTCYLQPESTCQILAIREVTGPRIRSDIRKEHPYATEASIDISNIVLSCRMINKNSKPCEVNIETHMRSTRLSGVHCAIPVNKLDMRANVPHPKSGWRV